jgi:xanthine dehydrogenase YagT iron-sulfur-binding subunit
LDEKKQKKDGGTPAAPFRSSDISRRDFIEVSFISLPAVGIAAASLKAATLASNEAPTQGIEPSQRIPIVLNVNGHEERLSLDPRSTLLDALRENLALPGTKKGCDHGQCGACTVLVDGRRVLSCLTLAASASEHKITTIEGLAQGDQLHPVQAAFLKHDGFQCGYCTPGQIVSAVGLLSEGCPGDAASVRECMSGNICRCGAYPNIVAAVLEARPGRSG